MPILESLGQILHFATLPVWNEYREMVRRHRESIAMVREAEHDARRERESRICAQQQAAQLREELDNRQVVIEGLYRDTEETAKQRATLQEKVLTLEADLASRPLSSDEYAELVELVKSIFNKIVVVQPYAVMDSLNPEQPNDESSVLRGVRDETGAWLTMRGGELAAMVKEAKDSSLARSERNDMKRRRRY
jgi:hypothetical protein